MMGNISALCRQKISQPLYGWFIRSPKLRYWKELERTQYLSEEQLRVIQWQRLQQLVGSVWRNNAFYRDRFTKAGITPLDIRSPEDLMLLPLLTKAEIRKAGSNMISNGFSIETLKVAKTGGSTGKALKLYFTEECSELRNACALRHDRWTGWHHGEPIAACWGNPSLPNTLKKKIKQAFLQPIVFLDTMSVNDRAVIEFASHWRKVRPTLLYGHAHSIFVLAQYLRRLGISDVTPRGILSTSMMLIASERKIIEETFRVRVIDRYGCEEVSLIGCECEKHEGMHLNIEHLNIEFIKENGEHSHLDEPGEIVVTDLMNYAMPFIRYKLEDVGVPLSRRCSCGRGLPMMSHIKGRIADFLIKRDGTKVAGVSLIENTLTKIDGIEQMQIIQNAINEFEVNIVTDPSFSNKQEKELKDYLKTVFGTYILIKIIKTDSIQIQKSGKYRFSICKLT